MSKSENWFKLEGDQKITSPALLVYPQIVKQNCELMVKMAGNPAILRPHIKTHKMAEIIKIQMNLGITKFKCATLSEAHLLARTGVLDILLAMQPAGPNIDRLFDLCAEYPNANLSTISDNAEIIKQLNLEAGKRQLTLPVWLDINNGMNRTGVRQNNDAFELYNAIHKSSNLKAAGLHVYDGHIHDNDLRERSARCNKAFLAVEQLIEAIKAQGMKIPKVIAGGTPTFPIHKMRKNIELSPGTPTLWDHGYSESFPDLKFKPAAVLLARVVSELGNQMFCLDLGHKSVASEMPLPRVEFLNLSKTTQISQHEEHLVIQTSDQLKVGSVCYAIPKHICPTVTKFDEVLTVEKNLISGSWQISARDHMIKTNYQ